MDTRDVWNKATTNTDESSETQQSTVSETDSSSRGTRDNASNFEGETTDRGVRGTVEVVAQVGGTSGIWGSMFGVEMKNYIQVSAETSMGFTHNQGWNRTRDTFSSSENVTARSNQTSESRNRSRAIQESNSTSKADFTIKSKVQNKTKSHGLESDRTQQEQQSESHEDRQTMASTVSIYSRFTPFPEMPVGSLLLVQVKRGQTVAGRGKTPLKSERILSVHTIANGMVKTVKEDSDFYIIINDSMPIAHERVGEDPELSVAFTREKSQTQAASEIYAIAEPILREVQKGEYQGTSEVTSTQFEALKSRILAAIGKKGIQIRDVPQMDVLVQSWILQELEQLELKARNVQFQRKVSILKRNKDRLEKDHSDLKTSQVLSAQQKLSSLSSYDVDAFGSRLVRSLTELRETVLPILQVRYPKIFQRLRIAGHDQLLSTLSPETSISGVAKKTEGFMETLNQELRTIAKGTDFTEETLIIRFPKAAFGVFECDELSQECPMTSPQLASQVWDAIENAVEKRITQ